MSKHLNKKHKYVLGHKPAKISQKQIVEALSNFYCLSSNVVVGQVVSEKTTETHTGLEKDQGKLFSRKISRV
jgi:hypothetical protein